jgi:hypothetical protein
MGRGTEGGGPQGLKPALYLTLTARLKPYPSTNRARKGAGQGRAIRTQRNFLHIDKALWREQNGRRDAARQVPPIPRSASEEI